jgi:glycerophosphoryl diester phosphodiesterase
MSLRKATPELSIALLLALPLCAHGAPDATGGCSILTSAHRGEHFHHPENSIPAIQAAIDAGMDFVELDVRTTSDGHLVLMHDATVNRMTDGTGSVDNMTLADIKKLDLGTRFPGQFPELRVPTFDEALETARGRIGIYVDTKKAAPQDLIAAIERHDMGSHVMFYSGHPDFLKQISELQPDWILMPEAVSPDNVRTVVDSLHPRFLGFDPSDFFPPTIAAAKEAHTAIFVDRQTEQQWKDALAQGVEGIQTDHPAELIAFLRANGCHK